MKKAWPDNEKPKAKTPEIEVKNGKLQINNLTKDLSVSYQINGAGIKGRKNHWYLYPQNVAISTGDIVTVLFTRIGYVDSDTVTVTN